MPPRVTYSKEQWSSQEEERVFQLLSEKKTVQEVSKLLNRSPNAIVHRFIKQTEEKGLSIEKAHEHSGIPMETLQSHNGKRESKPNDKENIKHEVKHEVKHDRTPQDKKESKKDKAKYNNREYKDEHISLLREIRDYLKIIATSRR